MDKKTIGTFISVLRKSKGLTQKELGDMLGVSDKAVSRWERDECAPDISLIPVIADIFGVTADELLRGEKSTEEKLPDFSKKSETVTKHIINTTIARFRTKSIISIALSVIGIIIAVIINYALLRAYIAFGVYMVLCVISVACEIIFAIGALSATETDDETFSKHTLSTKISVFRTAYVVIAADFSLALSCVPLLFTGDAYAGLMSGSWGVYGAVCFAVGVLLSLAVYVYVKAHMIKRLYRNIDTQESEKTISNARLAKKLASIAICVAIISGIGQITFSALDAKYFNVGRTFTNTQEFVEFMESPYAIPPVEASTSPIINNEAATASFYENIGDDTIAEPIYDYSPDGNSSIYDDICDFEPTDSITDKDGNVICTFVDRNHDVARYDIDEADGEHFKIRVYTSSDLVSVFNLKRVVNLASPIYYLALAAIFILIYNKKKIK